MNTIREVLETPIAGTYDVIVCGGGPAGSYAAIAAARAGAKTLLIERMNSLGGMSTSGYVNPLFDQEGKGGLTREVIDCLTARGAWGGFRVRQERPKSPSRRRCRHRETTIPTLR